MHALRQNTFFSKEYHKDGTGSSETYLSGAHVTVDSILITYVPPPPPEKKNLHFSSQPPYMQLHSGRSLQIAPYQPYSTMYILY